MFWKHRRDRIRKSNDLWGWKKFASFYECSLLFVDIVVVVAAAAAAVVFQLVRFCLLLLVAPVAESAVGCCHGCHGCQ